MAAAKNAWGSARPWYPWGAVVDALLLVLLGALALSPRLIEGRTALVWTRHHAARGAAATRPGEHLRQGGQWAVRALEAAAPLPFAAEAAWVALGLGQAAEARDGAAALTLYTEVRASVERLRGSRWRGLGLGGLAAEAGRLATAARERHDQ